MQDFSYINHHWDYYPPRRFYKKNRSAQPTLSRKMDVCLFRIRTGHNKLRAHLSNIGIEDSDTCRFCKANGSIEDCYHLLIQCRQLCVLMEVMKSMFGDEISSLMTERLFTNGFSQTTLWNQQSFIRFCKSLKNMVLKCEDKERGFVWTILLNMDTFI